MVKGKSRLSQIGADHLAGAIVSFFSGSTG